MIRFLVALPPWSRGRASGRAAGVAECCGVADCRGRPSGRASGIAEHRGVAASRGRADGRAAEIAECGLILRRGRHRQRDEGGGRDEKASHGLALLRIVSTRRIAIRIYESSWPSPVGNSSRNIVRMLSM
jgi:hypothetical protein